MPTVSGIRMWMPVEAVRRNEKSPKKAAPASHGPLSNEKTPENLAIHQGFWWI